MKMFVGLLIFALCLSVFSILYFDNRAPIRNAAGEAWLGFKIALKGLGVLILMATLFVGLLLLRKQANNTMRPRDGSFALMRIYHDPLLVRVIKLVRGQHCEYTIYNPNADMHYAQYVNGRVVAIEPSYGYTQQLEYTSRVQVTHHLQALTPGDNAVKDAVGWGRGGIANAATGRWLAGNYDRQPRQIAAEEEPPPQLTVVPTFDVALASTDRDEIPLGYSATDGELALWYPQRDPHFGVWGKTKTGKSLFVAMTVAVAWIRKHGQVIVLDPEQGKDWNRIANHAQVIPLIPGQVDFTPLDDLYERRQARLRELGASTIYHASTGMPPLLIILEEHNAWRNRTDGVGDETFIKLAQRGAATGMHLLVLAQQPTQIHRDVEYNLTTLTLRQGPKAGNVVGYYHAHHLGDGEFAFEGERYQSFRVFDSASKYLSSFGRAQVVDEDRMLKYEGGTLSVGVRESVRGCPSVGVPLVVDTPPTDTRTRTDTGKWGVFLHNWYDAHPDTRNVQANAARAMSVHEHGTDEYYRRYKSVVSEWYKEILHE